MAEGLEIQSKEVIDKISEDLKVQPAQKIPRKLSKDIQLSYDCNPLPEMQFKNLVISDSTSGIIHTTHATKRTFLVGIHLSVSKDANSTSNKSTVIGYGKGKAVSTLISIRTEPTTAGQGDRKSVV